MKDRARQSGRTSVFLLVLCFVLGYAVYAELKSGPIEPAAVIAAPPPQPAAARAAEPAFAMRPIGDFSETVTRPLFLPSRRPLEPSEEAPQIKTADVERDIFALIGVIISEGEHMALLRRRKTGEVLRVVEGQRVDGWRVEEIMADRMTLRQGDMTDEVALKDTVGAERKKRRLRDRRKRRTAAPPPTTEQSPTETAPPGSEAGQ